MQGAYAPHMLAKTNHEAMFQRWGACFILPCLHKIVTPRPRAFSYLQGTPFPHLSQLLSVYLDKTVLGYRGRVVPEPLYTKVFILVRGFLPRQYIILILAVIIEILTSSDSILSSFHIVLYFNNLFFNDYFSYTVYLRKTDIPV